MSRRVRIDRPAFLSLLPLAALALGATAPLQLGEEAAAAASAEGLPGQPRPSEQTAMPWPLLSDSWRTDEAWFDGRAEVAVYRSVEFAEGEARDSTATFFTNKQHMDPKRRVKVGAPGEDSVAVFKQHRSERVPAGAFELDLATITFSNEHSLLPFQATIATQDSCGASFKQLSADPGGYGWSESVYFPGGGQREGRLRQTQLVLEDQLPLLLRDFPFAEAQPGETQFRFDCLPSQRSARRVAWQTEGRIVRYAGSEVLGLETGEREGHALEVLSESSGELLGTYWFAAESAAPWLHAMLRYRGADGRRLELIAFDRDAYWKQN